MKKKCVLVLSQAMRGSRGKVSWCRKLVKSLRQRQEICVTHLEKSALRMSEEPVMYVTGSAARLIPEAFSQRAKAEQGREEGHPDMPAV
jgi:hypothetical protein